MMVFSKQLSIEHCATLLGQSQKRRRHKCVQDYEYLQKDIKPKGFVVVHPTNEVKKDPIDNNDTSFLANFGNHSPRNRKKKSISKRECNRRPSSSIDVKLNLVEDTLRNTNKNYSYESSKFKAKNDLKKEKILDKWTMKDWTSDEVHDSYVCQACRRDLFTYAKKCQLSGRLRPVHKSISEDSKLFGMKSNDMFKKRIDFLKKRINSFKWNANGIGGKNSKEFEYVEKEHRLNESHERDENVRKTLDDSRMNFVKDESARNQKSVDNVFPEMDCKDFVNMDSVSNVEPLAALSNFCSVGKPDGRQSIVCRYSSSSFVESRTSIPGDMSFLKAREIFQLKIDEKTNKFRRNVSGYKEMGRLGLGTWDRKRWQPGDGNTNKIYQAFLTNVKGFQGKLVRKKT
uniref:Uncharacterized protein n=1 Tax=Clastoptera arizonana TaxID=38151 RepID=A0A1B6C6B4_9HEMI